MRSALLGLAGIALGGPSIAGCAHGQAGASGSPDTAASGAPSATPSATNGRRAKRGKAQPEDGRSLAQAAGVYDWVYRGTDSQGNLRVEQEEWHLSQQGSALDGYYERTVTVLSGDERLFRCNQQLGFTRRTRVRVAGVLDGSKVDLREVAFEASPGPCDDGARNLVRYTGEVAGPTLKLRWSDTTAQTLHRRDGDAGAATARGAATATGAATSAGAAPATGAATEPLGEGPNAKGATPSDDGPSLPRRPGQGVLPVEPVSGVWTWELKSVDAEGDSRIEREEWHLGETPDGISGYYDRTVSKVRGEGTYACNGEARQENVTRYVLSGHRVADQVVLTEVDYKTSRSACDNGLRRLDTYQGRTNVLGDELVLSWGSGNQVLRRWHSK